MEPIYLDELLAASNFTAVNNLKTDCEESSSMKELIDNFVTDSNGNLQGDAWKEVQAKLSEFSNAMDMRITLATNLSEAISKALQILIDYIGDYPYLDYSQLPEIEASYKQCQTDIDNIRAALEAKTDSYVGEDEDGEKKYEQIYVVQGQARTDLSNRINEIEASMKEIAKLIEKLKGLEEKYNEAKAILDEAFAEVEEFGVSVSNIVPSDLVQYAPAS